jgi:mitogen-activated protein kinase 1/3
MKPDKGKDPKIVIPKGRVMYEVGGTQFVIDDKYEIIKQVGSGAYGVVASALNKQTNKKVAIKKVLSFFYLGYQCF